jgi:hypothetical protein
MSGFWEKSSNDLIEAARRPASIVFSALISFFMGMDVSEAEKENEDLKRFIVTREHYHEEEKK